MSLCPHILNSNLQLFCISHVETLHYAFCVSKSNNLPLDFWTKHSSVEVITIICKNQLQKQTFLVDSNNRLNVRLCSCFVGAGHSMLSWSWTEPKCHRRLKLSERAVCIPTTRWSYLQAACIRKVVISVSKKKSTYVSGWKGKLKVRNVLLK